MTPTNTYVGLTQTLEPRTSARSLRRFAPAVLALGAVLALVCLNGCATASGGSNDFEPNQYNPSTGYPAVGGGASWH